MGFWIFSTKYDFLLSNFSYDTYLRKKNTLYIQVQLIQGGGRGGDPWTHLLKLLPHTTKILCICVYIRKLEKS
jgi:hypothetical protein